MRSWNKSKLQASSHMPLIENSYRKLKPVMRRPAPASVGREGTA